ncbi:MAG: ester cyclase [Scandinavium sp.]|uniref:ester cyclase n=1 Tax=Scandinavium sp. TaxID=2830653 RepID=UPI003F336381
MVKISRKTLSVLTLAFTAYAVPAFAAEPVYPNLPVLKAHQYSATEQANLKTTAAFHQNFSAHNFEKNGPLVAKNIHVRSNGVEFFGRDKFVDRIGRFTNYFPDVAINDFASYADGNTTVVRFVITGTQKGDFSTPDGVVKAKGQKIKVEGIEIFTFDDAGQVADLVTVERGDQLIAQITGREVVQ